MKKILVVAAHPDDEILGVGGTVAKHVDSGAEVYAIILGEGQTSRGEQRMDIAKEVVEALHKDTMDSAKWVGYKEVYFADFPDNRFDEVDLLDIIKYIEVKVKEICPEIVYTHYSGDLNIDHQCTARAVLTATRPIGQYSVKEIYAFETLSSTEWNYDYSAHSGFNPNVFIDISDYYCLKENSMRCYTSELCEFPHPRSLKGMDVLSTARGMTVGVERAEAFMLIRKVD